MGLVFGKKRVLSFYAGALEKSLQRRKIVPRKEGHHRKVVQKRKGQKWPCPSAPERQNPPACSFWPGRRMSRGRTEKIQSSIFQGGMQGGIGRRGKRCKSPPLADARFTRKMQDQSRSWARKRK